MERNVTLDFVRGVAILGILLLNISAFGLPKAAYLNPAWYGDITRSDAWTWAVLDLFAQVKFLTLFALLFGAVEGVINASDKLIQRFKMPLPKTAAERHPQVFFSPDAFFNSDTPRLQQ